MMELLTALTVAFALMVSELSPKGENVTIVIKQAKVFYDRVPQEPDPSTPLALDRFPTPPPLSSRR